MGSEVERAIRAHEACRPDRFESTLERALELFDLTAGDPAGGVTGAVKSGAHGRSSAASSSIPTCRPTRLPGSGGTSSDSRGLPGPFIIADSPGTIRTKRRECS